MTEHTSLARTAIVAIALTIGFYTLAIALAGGLLFAAYAQVALMDHTSYRLVLFCAVAGLAILWSIIPRWDRFAAPGPRLSEEEHPELFALLRRVATATGQEMPADVYLIPEVNAYVMHRGGIMGIGSRRVMGLGLTLMQSLTVNELAAVVAHEFGHYSNGDLKFAGWIYKTRAAIERTVANLAQRWAALSAPFRLYRNLFIRITAKISRAQEFAADRLSANIAGVNDAASALIAVQGASYAYGPYLDTELGPVLSFGFRPPIAAGFASFVAAPAIEAAIAVAITNDLTEEEASIDSTHPPLRERIAALGAEPAPRSSTAVRATSLLRDLDRLETQLLEVVLTDPAAARTMHRVQWEEAGTRVFLPAWQKRAGENVEKVRGLTPERLPELVRSADPDTAGAAFAARLHDLGWMCDATPGRPVAFTRDGRTIEPFKVVKQIADGELAADAWQEECRSAGIEDVVLA